MDAPFCIKSKVARVGRVPLLVFEYTKYLKQKWREWDVYPYWYLNTPNI
jgi:hypothetical protein